MVSLMATTGNTVVNTGEPSTAPINASEQKLPELILSTSYQTRVPAKFKHIIKRRKRKQKRFPK